MRRLYWTILCSLLFLTGYSQDPTEDRWTDVGNETLIDLPAVSDGRVTITKWHPNTYNFNELLRLKVNYSASEYLSFRNAATGTTSFVPAMFAYNQTPNASAFMLIGVTDPANDITSGGPMINFNARRYPDNSLISGGGPLLSRSLFSWSNYSTVHMLMRANGNLGLGTEWPQTQFHTTGGVRFAGLPVSSGTSVVMADTDGNLSKVTLPSNGTIAVVGNASPNSVPRFNSTGVLSSGQIFDDGVKIGVGGVPISGSKLALYGTLKLMSDARSKTNVVKMTNAMQKVNALNGYYYDWKSGSAGREVGFLAQEVEQVLPEAVSENADGVKFLNYDGVLPLLTEAIKEQQALIKSQSALIEQLRREVDALKRKR